MADSIDRVMREWAATRPELDVDPIAVISRLDRLRPPIDRAREAVFARHGLTGPDFAVLTTLIRLAALEISQRELTAELGLTSGTVSVRIDRLAAAGLVTRGPDPGDRRGALVALTERGRAAFEACAPEHLANERQLLAALDEHERAILAGLLGTLLESLETEHTGIDALGITVAAAPVAMRARRGVGLSERAGLLVRHVRDDAPAAATGLRAGDLLVGADDRRVRTPADLDDALAAGARDLTVVRGADELRLELRDPPKQRKPPRAI